MKQLFLGLGTALLAVATAGVSAAPAVIGDYVEARSCNVFAGPCHYGSEYTTAGREAIMVWRVRHGVRSGQTLDGLTAVAAVAAEENLSVAGERRSIFYVDQRATPAQRAALVEMLRARTGADFGRVLAVRPAAIRFDTSTDGTQVEVANVARLSTLPMPDAACCRWPGERWYEPLSHLAQVRVGNAAVNEYDDSLLNVRWMHNGQNSVLFGDFSF